MITKRLNTPYTRTKYTMKPTMPNICKCKNLIPIKYSKDHSKSGKVNPLLAQVDERLFKNTDDRAIYDATRLMSIRSASPI